MELKIKDMVELLQISEKTLYRWIQEKKIPCYRINHQYRFNRTEINEWILSQKIELAPRLLDLAIAGRPTHFTDLLLGGGIHYELYGGTVREVLCTALDSIRTPVGVAKADILAALLDREGMMSTGIGRGIAIPHPRNPIIAAVEDARVALCFPKVPVDFGALDGRPVHAFFILLTSSPRRHLEVLSKISYLCHLDAFTALLDPPAPAQALLAFIREQEAQWQARESKPA